MAEHTKKQKPMTIEISEAKLQEEVEAFNAVNAQIQQVEGSLVQMRAEREQRSGRLSILQEQLSKAMGNDQEQGKVEAQNNGEGDPGEVPSPQDDPDAPPVRQPPSTPPQPPEPEPEPEPDPEAKPPKPAAAQRKSRSRAKSKRK